MRHTELTALLEQAGLDGRGGAGFPASVKVARAQRHRAGLIVNACDGEIGSGKDTYVVTRHLPEVLDAVALLRLGGARFAVHRDSVAHRMLAGHGLDVLPVPPRYVSSEASALVALGHGRPAKPLGSRFRTVDGGRDGDGRRYRPTVVFNAETMLRISQIHAFGPRWFRSWGTPDEPGPRLVTISGDVARPGVHETQAGTPLPHVLSAAGPARPDQPVHIAGLGSGWLTGPAVAHAVWSRQWLAPRGLSTGAGTLHVLSPQDCPLDHTGRLVRDAAGESAGQCGPCMFGLPALADAFTRAAGGDLSALARTRVLIGQVDGRGGCHFPDSVARLVAGTLREWAAEFEAHAAGRCLATLREPAVTR